jgi:hypothetical protein
MLSKTRVHPSIQRSLVVVDRVVSRVSFEILLSLLFLGFTLFLVVEAPQYRGHASLFPLLVGIPLSLMLGALTIHQVRDAYTTNDDGDSVNAAEGRSFPRTNVAVAKNLGWLLAFIAIIVVFGFELGALLYLLVQYSTVRNWKRAIVMALVPWIIILLVFSFVLKVPFPTGVLDISLL